MGNRVAVLVLLAAVPAVAAAQEEDFFTAAIRFSITAGPEDQPFTCVGIQRGSGLPVEDYGEVARSLVSLPNSELVGYSECDKRAGARHISSGLPARIVAIQREGVVTGRGRIHRTL